MMNTLVKWVILAAIIAVALLVTGAMIAVYTGMTIDLSGFREKTEFTVKWRDLHGVQPASDQGQGAKG